MHADEIFRSILNEIPRTMGWMKEVEVPIVEDWIVPTQDDYLRAYFKGSDILIVEYKGKYLEVPCNIDSDDATIARKIMGAFAQIVLKKAGKEKSNIKINENRKMKQTIRLNESQLREIVKESVERVLHEGLLTQWAARAEAKKRLNQIKKDNKDELPNTPEVQKLQRQFNTFSDFHRKGPNRDERDVAEFKELLTAFGLNVTDQQIKDYDTIEHDYGGKYDYTTQTQRQMENHKMIKDALDKIEYNEGESDGVLYDPRDQFVFDEPTLYDKVKGWFMGKKPHYGWRFSPEEAQQAQQARAQQEQLSEQRLNRAIMESVKRVLGEQKRVLREFGYDNKRDDLIGMDLQDAIRQAESEGWKWNPRSEKRNGETLETTLYAGDKMDTGGYGSAYLYIVSRGDDTDGTFIVEYACETFN